MWAVPAKDLFFYFLTRQIQCFESHAQHFTNRNWVFANAVYSFRSKIHLFFQTVYSTFFDWSQLLNKIFVFLILKFLCKTNTTFVLQPCEFGSQTKVQRWTESSLYYPMKKRQGVKIYLAFGIHFILILLQILKIKVLNGKFCHTSRFQKSNA